MSDVAKNVDETQSRLKAKAFNYGGKIPQGNKSIENIIT